MSSVSTLLKPVAHTSNTRRSNIIIQKNAINTGNSVNMNSRDAVKSNKRQILGEIGNFNGPSQTKKAKQDNMIEMVHVLKTTKTTLATKQSAKEREKQTAKAFKVFYNAYYLVQNGFNEEQFNSILVKCFSLKFYNFNVCWYP
jgi:hypothetical protein